MEAIKTHITLIWLVLTCNVMVCTTHSKDSTQNMAVELYKQWRTEFNNVLATHYPGGLYPPLWGRRHGEHLSSYQAMVHSSNAALNYLLLDKVESLKETGDGILASVLCDRMGWDLEWVYRRHPHEINERLAICAEFKKIAPSQEYWSSLIKFDARGIMQRPLLRPWKRFHPPSR